MAWYFGPDIEWTPKVLYNNDFAYELIGEDVFKGYNQMAKYLEEHTEDIVEVTSIEDELGRFDTTFVTEEGVTFALTTVNPIGDILEENEEL